MGEGAGVVLEVGGEDLGAVPEVVALDFSVSRSVSQSVSGVVRFWFGLVWFGGRDGRRWRGVGTHKGLCPTRRRCSFWPESKV